MYTKLKAVLITLLIILWIGGIINTAMSYPSQTQNVFMIILTAAGIYWLYKLILSIIENK